MRPWRPSGSAHGIYLRNCRNMTVHDNTVSHFTGDGLRAWYSWYLVFENNHSSYNSNWGLSVFDGDSFVFRNNRAYGNADGGLDYENDEGHVNAGGNYPIP